MARTATMKLIELIILKNDINKVIEYLGKDANFQFYTDYKENSTTNANQNLSRDIFEKLQTLRSYLKIEDIYDYTESSHAPMERDFELANAFISRCDTLREKEIALLEEQKRVKDAYTEALAFVNLKASYSELEHLSFLSLRIGKIDPNNFDELSESLNKRAVIVPLGEDKSRILAASSRKARFVLETELKNYGFVPIEIPKDFKGIPDDVLAGLKEQAKVIAKRVDQMSIERKNFAQDATGELYSLLQIFSIGMQINVLRDKLEATDQVYRITGWVPAKVSQTMLNQLDSITEGRIAIRQYAPNEVSAVRSGNEQVPVKLVHNAFVKSFQGMIFGYGAPLYGTIDPTPFVAFFYTLLFGLMFGDAGQGLFFVLVGFLLHFRVLKLESWRKYAFIFIAIGTSSFLMGLLTGEFFANTTLLRPFGLYVTGLVLGPENAFAPILELMPHGSDSVNKLFMFFGFTVAIGVIINSIGLVINFINNISLRRYPQAFLGKNGILGALFFWYTLFMVIRIVLSGGGILWYDWVVLGSTATGTFFAHPLERFFNGHRPIYENGFGPGLVESVVEVYELLSGYFSNTVSFLRVGAFALSHVVLGYVIFTMTDAISEVHTVLGIIVLILGNTIVIFLEGLIVAIQVIRLQYYEFFSKFFNETGTEFQPFRFIYKN